MIYVSKEPTPIHSTPEEAGFKMKILEVAIKDRIKKITKKYQVDGPSIYCKDVKLELHSLIDMLPEINKNFYIKSY